MISMKAEGLKRLGIGLVLLAIIAGGSGVGTTGRVTASPGAPQAGTLHNPTFDNHYWYEFNDRYGKWYAGSWVPDDDIVNGPQSWRLWYMRGRPLIKSFAENAVVQAVESVATRTYDGNIHEGGIYQTIYDVVPCLYYTFQIYALSRPDSSVPDKTAVLRVGIDQTGWATDPAFPGYYPATIVWGEAHDYKYPNFGALSATAEAHANKITVFTYAYLLGGPQHTSIWDTASLNETTPAVIHPFNSLPAAGGITGLSPSVGSNQAQISWQTPGHTAVSQVYYQLAPQPRTPVDYQHKVYLPYVSTNAPTTWMVSPLNKIASETPSILLTGLMPGRTYSYIAVSRGLDNGQCVTWVSSPQTFTLMP